MDIRAFNINVTDTLSFRYNDEVDEKIMDNICRLYVNSSSDRYVLQVDSLNINIEVEPYTNVDIITARDILRSNDCLYLGKILDINAKKKVILIQFSRFVKHIVLPPDKKMQIHITDSVAPYIGGEKHKDPGQRLKDEFVMDNRYLFVMGSYNDKLNQKFTVISPNKVLTVVNEDKYRIEKIAKNWYKGGYYDKPIVVIQGTIEFTDSTFVSTLPPELMDELGKSIEEGRYLKIWNLYNKLEEAFVINKANEFGSMEYKTYRVQPAENGVKLTFKMVNDIPDQLFSEHTELVWGYESGQDSSFKTNSTFQHYFAGRFISNESKGKKLVTILDNELHKKMPNKTGGFLFISTSGDTTRIWRREQARDIIANNSAPILGLGKLIENGTSVYKERSSLKPITHKLLSSLNGIKPLPSQKEAISIALNTPDIALIQGPPGTGKTTVIRAIINRFIEEGEKTGYIPKILLTSYQHDAVDNAIEGWYFAGMPANRLGKRRGEDEDRLNEIMWVEKVKEHCSKVIAQHTVSQVKSIAVELEEKIFMLYSKENYEAEAIDLLNYIYLRAANLFDSSLRSRLEDAIIKYNDLKEKNNEEGMTESIYLKHLNQLLESQRITPESFEDDGLFQAKKLARFIQRHNDELNIHEYDILMKIIDYKENTRINKNLLSQYKEWIDSTKVKVKPVGSTVDKDRYKATIDVLLKDITEALRQKAVTDFGTAADIVYEYSERMQDYDERKKVIGKYSSVIATTCQHSVAKRFIQSDNQNIYDVVIVDEAARANPLDLFIPMSLGKKVILVGDHKQLPHILEDNLVKEFVRQNEGIDEKDLKTSLFEKLFNMLEKQQEVSGIVRTTALNEQFRMHPIIGELVNTCFYKNISSTYVKVNERLHNTGLFKNRPLAWIDVPETYGKETLGMSKTRKIEIDIIMEYIKKIIMQDNNQKIGIISFYARQAEKFKDEIEAFNIDIRSNIKVGTVDSFQGREFDIVFLSCVRCNNHNDLRARLGFLNDESRLCVAFSRARKLFVVVGDSKTIARDNDTVYIESLNKLLEICKNGEGY